VKAKAVGFAMTIALTYVLDINPPKVVTVSIALTVDSLIVDTTSKPLKVVSVPSHGYPPPSIFPHPDPK